MHAHISQVCQWLQRNRTWCKHTQQLLASQCSFCICIWPEHWHKKLRKNTVIITNVNDKCEKTPGSATQACKHVTLLQIGPHLFEFLYRWHTGNCHHAYLLLFAACVVCTISSVKNSDKNVSQHILHCHSVIRHSYRLGCTKEK